MPWWKILFALFGTTNDYLDEQALPDYFLSHGRDMKASYLRIAIV